ncbi:MAG: tetratricopeptide repeat protein [Eubacteriales bacterium]|nr:tetratricopeptide repeat protein [Eubacteriales bacterium]
MKKALVLFLALAAALLTGCGVSQEAQEQLENGMTAIENSSYEEALAAFSQVISKGELLVEAWRGTGIAYMGQGELAKAVDAFDQALANTDDKMNNTRKDILYYKATALYKQGDYAETANVCDEILKLANEGDAHYLKGASALAQDQKDLATTEFQAAAKLCSDDYDMLLNIYECYNQKNLSAEGDVYLQQALNIQGSGSDTAYQKARIYYYLEDYDKAKAMLASGVEEGDAKSLLLMGKVYLKLSDTAHSRVMYQRYIEANGETAESLNGIVLCDIEEGNYESALANIEKGLALEGDEGKQELAFNAIVAWEKQGNFDAAKEKAAQYAEQYPADEKGQKEYAFLLSR